MKKVRVIVSGVCGRMGRKIASFAAASPDVELAGAIEQGSSPFIGKDIGEAIGIARLNIAVQSDLCKIIRDCDCLIEFTTPQSTCEHVKIAEADKKAVVIGTTGLDGAQIDAIKNSSKKIPIVLSPNMSIGMNVLFRITAEASRVLGSEYSASVEEVHHVHKKDAPSGTAKKIAEIIKENKKDGLQAVEIKSERTGEVVGDHKVIFRSEFETLELCHSAKSRDVFAKGAIAAAKFVVGKRPGLYTMEDALGF